MLQNHRTVVAALEPPLGTIVERGLAAEKSFAESWTDWGTAVLFARPFLLTHPVPEGIEHHIVNDPRYWLAEYIAIGCEPFVACRF